MQTAEAPSSQADTRARPGLGWAELMFWGALGVAAALLVGMVALGEIIPPVIVFGVAFIGAALFARRRTRGGAITLVVFSILTLALNMPFIIPSLMVPASTTDFVMTTTVIVALAVTLIASVAVLRRRAGGPTSAAKIVGLGALALIALSIATAAAARVTYDSPVAQQGDVRLVTEDIEFSTENLSVEGGEVTVFVENKDATFHTFTIEELGVDLQIPGNSSGRVTFDAPEGSYTFICEPHEDLMEGRFEAS
jgi:plastocyanin